MLGNSVEPLQRETGTKDKVAEYWLQILIKKAKDAQEKDPNLDPEDIAKDLADWLKKQPGDKMNPLLDIAGTISVYYIFLLH